MDLKAANVSMHDIVNNNKACSALEIQNFFTLMEVFGYQFPANYFDPQIYPLSMQRRKSQKDLLLLKLRLLENLEMLQNETVLKS